MSLLRLLFDPRGRIGRGRFWLGTFLVIAACVFVTVFGGLFAPSGAEPTYHFIMRTVTVLLIFVIVSFAALGAKRLHDRGKAAFWLVVFYPVPAALYWYGTARQEPSLAMMAASCVLLLWAIIELGFLPGTAGENAYGANPSAGLTAENAEPTLDA